MQVAFILNVDIVVASFNSTVLKLQQMLKYSLANCFRIVSIFEPERVLTMKKWGVYLLLIFYLTDPLVISRTFKTKKNWNKTFAFAWLIFIHCCEQFPMPECWFCVLKYLKSKIYFLSGTKMLTSGFSVAIEQEQQEYKYDSRNYSNDHQNKKWRAFRTGHSCCKLETWTVNFSQLKWICHLNNNESWLLKKNRSTKQAGSKTALQHQEQYSHYMFRFTRHI